MCQVVLFPRLNTMLMHYMFPPGTSLLKTFLTCLLSLSCENWRYCTFLFCGVTCTHNRVQPWRRKKPGEAGETTGNGTENRAGPSGREQWLSAFTYCTTCAATISPLY